MTILNAPSREECIARRERTNTPLQALLLLNQKEYLRAARSLAIATLGDASLENDAELLRAIYETVTSHVPDERESAALLAAATDLGKIYGGNPEMAAQVCEAVKPPAGGTASKLASWTLLVSSIQNLDITKTRQ